MLRYADAIVKRGVDKLIDAIAHNPELQTKNAETPQPQKSMGNDTDCASQTTGQTANCGLTEQAITLMDELYNIRYNVLDRTPEVQRRDQADKGVVPVNKLVRNTMVIDLHKRGCMVWNNDVDRIVESAYMPQYHPFSAYLQSLSQWDGTDRVSPLAERVSTDALWRMVFGRWLRCMVAGWVQAAAGGASTSGNAMIPLLVSEEQGVRKSTFAACCCLPNCAITTPTSLSWLATSVLNWHCRALRLSTLTSLTATTSCTTPNLRIWCSLAPCRRAAPMLPGSVKWHVWPRL